VIQDIIRILGGFNVKESLIIMKTNTQKSSATERVGRGGMATGWTHRRTSLVAIAAIGMSWCATSRTASAGAIDINGGSSWGGWELRGNSRDVGIWAKDSTTRDYDLYTTVFVSTTTQ
jgi:hypothetical protein